MRAKFPRASTRPLTPESYQRAAAKAIALAQNVGYAARSAHSVLAKPRDKARLTRAIRSLAMHAKRLSALHRGMSVVDEVAEEDAEREMQR